MFSRLLVFIIISLFHIKVLAQDNKWDLRRCVEYGMKNNITVKQAEIQADRSEINFKQSSLQPLPSLSYGLTHGFSFGRTLDRTTNVYTSRSAMFQQMSLQSNVLLYNFNSTRNNALASKYSMDADKATVEKAMNDVALNIAQQYLRALLSYEQVGISLLVLDQTKAQLSNTRKLVDAGSLPELNAAELEATLARDSATYIQAKSQAELDKLSLKAVLNLPADQSFELVIPEVDRIPVDNILEIYPEDVYQAALKSQPQIRVNDLRLLAAEKGFKVAEARMKPTVSAFGQLATNFNQFLLKGAGLNFTGEQQTGSYIKQGSSLIPVYSPSYDVLYEKRNFSEYWNGFSRQLRDQFGQGVGISLNVPILNGGQARANMHRAKVDIKSSQLSIDRDKLQLKQDIYNAYYSASGAFQTYLARDKALATAIRSFELANRRYELGVMQTIEWLSNQNNVTRARIDKAVAQYEYIFRMKVLEFYKGQGLKL